MASRPPATDIPRHRAPRPPRTVLACLAVALALMGPAPAARAQLAPRPATMMPPAPMLAKEFAFIQEAGVYHLFWMRHDPGAPYDSTEHDFGHAVSTDLWNWTQLDSVIPVRPGKWDNLHVWTPTIVKIGGTFYMYYTGVTSVPFPWNSYQRIGVATSTDLLNWTRYDAPVWSGDMVPWAFSDSSSFAGCQFRDAYVMPDTTAPGRLLMYYVGTPSAARDQLIVGVAQATDPFTWSDVTPLWCTDTAHYWGWCESPHVIQHDSLTYLFVTTTSGHPLAYRTAPTPYADSTLWSGTHRVYDAANDAAVSDAWFGSETLSIPGHDYFAVVNSVDFEIDIFEMVWGGPSLFTLATPAMPLGVGPRDAPARMELAPLGRARPGQGLLLRASVPAACTARVELFDVAGRRLRTLHDGPLPAGPTIVPWDGRVNGAPAGCGIYFAALTTGRERRVARVPVVW